MDGILNIWYLVSVLDLFFLFGGKNESSFDKSILANFLDDGNLDNILILFFLSFFIIFVSHYYKKVGFLTNLYFDSLEPNCF